MTNKKIAVKWIEALLLILILLAGLGLGTFATLFINAEREIRRPREEEFIRTAQLPNCQTDAATAQAELTSLRAKILDQKVDLAKLSAKLESLRSTYPALDAPEGAPPALNLKPEIKTAFTQTQFDIESTKKVLSDLTNRLPEMTANATEKALSLNKAQEAVHKSFDRAQKDFQLTTNLLILGASLAVSVIVLIVGLLLAGFLNWKEDFGIRKIFVFVCGLAMLFALSSYQAFQVAGVTLAVLILAFVGSMIALLSRRERAPVKVINSTPAPQPKEAIR